jgi:hypothetical protein
MSNVMEGLEGWLEGLFRHLDGHGCGLGRIGRINKSTPQHMRALTHVYYYISIILPILPSPYSMRSICYFNPSKVPSNPSNLQECGDVMSELWTMERPRAGEDAAQVAWHIAYLLAGEMAPEEVEELARLRRVQRWLGVAPERRAALRLALVAASAVRLAGGVR